MTRVGRPSLLCSVLAEPLRVETETLVKTCQDEVHQHRRSQDGNKGVDASRILAGGDGSPAASFGPPCARRRLHQGVRHSSPASSDPIPPLQRHRQSGQPAPATISPTHGRKYLLVFLTDGSALRRDAGTGLCD